MSQRAEMWKNGLYLEGRDFGHDFKEENPEVDYVELQANIYNFLMEFEPNLIKYTELCDRLAHQAAERVWEVAGRKRDRYGRNDSRHYGSAIDSDQTGARPSMIYESKEDAVAENSGAMTALEIVEMLKESHGYVLHATNVGQDAIGLKSKYVEYKPLNQQGKPSKLYLQSGIPAIIDSLIKKAKRRESYGQVVR